MKPDYCTSLMCKSTNCTNCTCSHAVFLGKGIDRYGKLWKWSFQSYHGPLFLCKDGEPLKNQPCNENHPAWEPFEKWNKRRIKKENN